MPIILRPGMTVEGRKRKPFGINTYIGLDYISAAKELNRRKRNVAEGACLPPRRDMPYAPCVHVCKAMNRARLARDATRIERERAFHTARTVSFKLDRLQSQAMTMSEIASSPAGQAYKQAVSFLYTEAHDLFIKLIKLESSRGRHWCTTIPMKMTEHLKG